MHVERNILSALALALLWLISATGCVLDEEELELRTDNTPQYNDPIPGGGPCKRCVRGYRQDKTNLHLCVDTSVLYVSDPAEDGTPIHKLLTATGTESDWEIVTNEQPGAANQCVGGACTGTVLPEPNGQFVVVDIPVIAGPDPLYIVLTAFGGRPHGSNLTTMPRILLERAPESSAWPCDPAYQEPSGISSGNTAGLGLTPAALPQFMAQIALPWPSGGVRSCSGVLISPHHILTAAHCFDHVASLDYNLEDQVDVRFGSGPWLKGKSVADVILHPDYQLKSIDADMAIIELDPESGQAIKPARLVSFQLGTPVGDFWAYGYGTRPNLDTVGYDWGMLKKTTGLKSAPGLADAQDLEGHLVLAQAGDSVPLCQGDSGGPVLAKVDGVETVVAVLAARILPDATDSIRLDGMYDALAFSHGNTCGAQDGDELGYAATPIGPSTRTWIDTVIGTLPPLTQ